MRAFLLTLLLTASVSANAQTYTATDGSTHVPGESMNWEVLGNAPRDPSGLSVTYTGRVYTYESVNGSFGFRYYDLQSGVWHITGSATDPYPSRDKKSLMVMPGTSFTGADTLMVGSSATRYSVDGGGSWVYLNDGGETFYEADNSVIYRGRGYSPSQVAPARSLDRGLTWIRGTIDPELPMGITAVNVRGMVQLPQDHPVAPGRLVAGSHLGGLYSEDGATWTRSDLWEPYRISVQSVAVTKQGRVLALVLDNQRPGTSLFGSDDGVTWTYMGWFDVPGLGNSLITLAGDDHNRAVGDATAHGRLYAASGKRWIWYTDDGGDTWFLSPDRLPGTHYLNDASDHVVGPDGFLYATVSARDGFAEDGGVYRSTPPPVAEARDPDVARVAVSVAPNPSRTSMTVSVTLPSATDLRVEVVDVLGRRLSVLRDGPAAAGEQTIGSDVSGLPPGVYTITVSAGGERHAERFTVVR